MLPSSVRILVCTEAQDMRRSYDALAMVTRERLGEDPQSGALYIFIGKRPTRVKVLWWDRNGYCLLAKRLHRALFIAPRAQDRSTRVVQIDGAALAQLLAGVDCEKRERRRLM